MEFGCSAEVATSHFKLLKTETYFFNVQKKLNPWLDHIRSKLPWSPNNDWVYG